jgi:uncharacterized membrane protein YdjX (TVP38/TMEM64 family)
LAALAGLAALGGWVLVSWANGGVMALVLSTSTTASEKLSMLEAFFAGWGLLAPLVYVGLVLVEAIIAPIPGAILYLPGGVIFGGFWGGTLSLIGNVLAAGACAWLVRTVLGERLLGGAIRDGRLPGLRDFILRHGVMSIALLRVNPLTSSDLVSYAAGLSPLPIRTVMLGTLVGMAPLCYLQSYLAMELFETFPWLLWPFLILCGVYAVFLAWALFRIPRVGTVSQTPDGADR